MVRKIVTNIRELRQKTVPVTPEDNIKEIVTDLKETLAALGHGYALAANQIGINKSIFYCKIPKNQNPETKEINYVEIVIINPEIVEKDKKFVHYGEGCLSFPGLRVDCDRYEFITIKYQTEKFEPQQFFFADLEAVVIQHELDHLSGQTIFDKKHRSR